MTDSSTDPFTATGIDTTIPHSARIWNYWLGGKDNYAADRAAGEAWVEVHPDIVTIARATRAFLARAVTHLAGEAGIRQFLDVGTGLPTADNTHEVAQRVAPDARIVYVDHDPLVLAHARALLTSTPEGATCYLDADMRDSGGLLAEARKVLDFTRPVALIFMGVLGHIADLGEARALVRVLLDAMPSGSYLLLCDGVHASETDTVLKALDDYSDTGAMAYHTRSRDEIRSFFDGLEWVDPGFVSVPVWRPEIGGVDVATIGTEQQLIDQYGGLARKP